MSEFLAFNVGLGHFFHAYGEDRPIKVAPYKYNSWCKLMTCERKVRSNGVTALVLDYPDYLQQKTDMLHKCGTQK